MAKTGRGGNWEAVLKKQKGGDAAYFNPIKHRTSIFVVFIEIY